MHKPPFAHTVLLALLSVSALPALADNAQRVHQACSRYLDEQPDYYESRNAAGGGEECCPRRFVGQCRTNG